jgi:hypothetical protein
MIKDHITLNFHATHPYMIYVIDNNSICDHAWMHGSCHDKCEKGRHDLILMFLMDQIVLEMTLINFAIKASLSS